MSAASPLDALAEEIRAHRGCGFEPCETAANPVPGEGAPDADVMFVGEAPGAQEDKQGRPFVGAAGRLLDALLESIELRHRGWVEGERREQTLSHLDERDAAFVSVDAPRGDQFTIMPPLDAVTRPELAYLRAHGRNLEGYVRGRSVAERFGYEYAREELEEIATRARGLAEEADAVHVMFNNNRGADAPQAAQRMRELLSS